MVRTPPDAARAYTSPENRGLCGFCGKEEGGYAKQDSKGKWQAACWPCVRPAAANAPQPKRHMIRSLTTNSVIVTGDPDENPAPIKGKAPGMAPSSYRPKVK